MERLQEEFGLSAQHAKAFLDILDGVSPFQASAPVAPLAAPLGWNLLEFPSNSRSSHALPSPPVAPRVPSPASLSSASQPTCTPDPHARSASALQAALISLPETRRGKFLVAGGEDGGRGEREGAVRGLPRAAALPDDPAV